MELTKTALYNLGPFSAYIVYNEFNRSNEIMIGLDGDRIHKSSILMRISIDQWEELKNTVDAVVAAIPAAQVPVTVGQVN